MGEWDAGRSWTAPDEFVFAVQGPASIAVMEELTQSDLRDLAFARTRMVTIGGHRRRLLRAGVTGELGYEIHGPAEPANEIRSLVVEAGREHGLRQLGGVRSW
ncbi:hypothetical protein ACU61A_39965 [Pseudonocardia sichuanensis]